jgi:hypothetical protein
MEQDGTARTKPIERTERHRLCQAVAEPNDLGRDTMSIACRQQQAVADGNVPAQPIDVDHETGQPGYPPFQAQQSDVV